MGAVITNWIAWNGKAWKILKKGNKGLAVIAYPDSEEEVAF